MQDVHFRMTLSLNKTSTSVATGLFLACVQTSPFPQKKIGKRGQITRDAPGVGLHWGSQKVTFYRICVDYVVQWKGVWTICFKVRHIFLENINTHSLQRKCTRVLDFRWCWCLVQLTWQNIIFHRKLAALFFHWQYSTSTMERSRTSTNFRTIAESASVYSLWVNRVVEWVEAW